MEASDKMKIGILSLYDSQRGRFALAKNGDKPDRLLEEHIFSSAVSDMEKKYRIVAYTILAPVIYVLDGKTVERQMAMAVLKTIEEYLLQPDGD